MNTTPTTTAAIYGARLTGDVPATNYQLVGASLYYYYAAGSGIPWKSLWAAVSANGMAESKFRRTVNAAGAEDSVGIFQCNVTAGLGKGHARADLEDPIYNMGVVWKEAARQGIVKKFANAADNADTAAAISAWWVAKVERPADIAGESAKRSAMARNIYGRL